MNSNYFNFNDNENKSENENENDKHQALITKNSIHNFNPNGIVTVFTQKNVQIVFNLNNLKRFNLIINETSTFQNFSDEMVSKFMTLFKEFGDLEGSLNY